MEVKQMLIQFTLKNFLSFKDEATLDMSAIPAYKDHEYNLIKTKSGDSFLKVATIYGANASGKSNVFAALCAFQGLVVESFNSTVPGEESPLRRYYRPFQFDQEQNNTEFEIMFLIEDTEYQYGFEYNEEEIVSEWLYEKNTQTDQTTSLFERNHAIILSDEIQKECSAYTGQIPKETLVLTFLSRLKLKNPIFKKIYSKITSIIAVTNRYYHSDGVIQGLLPEIIDKDKGNLLKFLDAIGAGITDIEYQTKNQSLYFSTTHEDKDKNKYKLPLYNESEGTIKSILIYAQAQKAIKNHRTMLIDELNTQLHPLLLKFIIDLFYNKNSQAQLIYTTHDTTLLDQRFFRRDQIWFVQKDSGGHSTLTSLAEYQIPREGTFGLNYLAGVYGAIPDLGDFDLKVGD